MIYIVNINAQKFSLNGIHYFKNFSPVVFDGSDSLKIVNIYDSRFELVPFTRYDEFQVDSVTYGSVAELQEALLPVLFTRANLGAGGGIESVNGSSVDNSDPLNPVVNPFSFQETTDISPITTQSIEVGGLTITGKIAFVTSLITALRNVSFPDKDGTVAYLDDISALLEGIAWKQPVELNLTSGIDDISPAVIGITSLTQQGVTLVDGSRVIVSGLTNQAKNGIYRVSASLITGVGGYTYYRLFRTNDANTGAELNNAVVGVTSGTHAGKTYRQSTLNPIVTTSNVGGSNIIFTEFGNSTVANATNILAGIAKLYNSIGTETDGGITPNAVKVGLDSKANLTQVGNLLRQEFTFSGSQTFTLANNYGQVYSVEVQGQGALSNSQYTLVAPNQITINDTLDSGDYIVVIYSNAITGVQPYYSQAEVDGLLALKSNSNQTPRTWKSGIDGVTVANTLTITPTYTQLIPANTFTTGDVVELLFRSTTITNKTSASNIYIYVNSTPNLSGTPLQLAIYTSGATSRTIQMERTLSIKGTTTKVTQPTATSQTDTTITGIMSTLTIDWTINQHIIFAIGHTVADQTLIGDFYRIIKN